MREVENLYALLPSEFTNARNALVRRLIEEGRPDDAARVKSLRKPTFALWAVNQAARRHPDELRRFVELGDDVRTAQVEGRARDFRAAVKERSNALARLLERVRDVLEEAEGAAAHVDRAGRTIEAAAADAAERDALFAGALQRELEPGGFGDVFGLLPEEPAPDAPDARRLEEAEEARENARTLIERARAARRAADAREREAKEAEATGARARRAADRAAKKAAAAEADAEAAARRADELLE